jgi:hypothetical protein
VTIARGEVHCKECSEINRDIKAERKIEITRIKESREAATLLEVPRSSVIFWDFKQAS